MGLDQPSRWGPLTHNEWQTFGVIVGLLTTVGSGVAWTLQKLGAVPTVLVASGAIALAVTVVVRARRSSGVTAQPAGSDPTIGSPRKPARPKGGLDQSAGKVSARELLNGVDRELWDIAVTAARAHPLVAILGSKKVGTLAFAPRCWPLPLPPLGRGTSAHPSWWLAFWFADADMDRGWFSLKLWISPMIDQPMRMQIVDRLTRNPGEFQLRREDFQNHPGVPTQWVRLAGKDIFPLREHGLSAAEIRRAVDDAITEFATRFAKVGDAISPLVSHTGS